MRKLILSLLLLFCSSISFSQNRFQVDAGAGYTNLASSGWTTCNSSFTAECGTSTDYEGFYDDGVVQMAAYDVDEDYIQLTIRKCNRTAFSANGEFIVEVAPDCFGGRKVTISAGETEKSITINNPWHTASSSGEIVIHGLYLSSTTDKYYAGRIRFKDNEFNEVTSNDIYVSDPILSTNSANCGSTIGADCRVNYSGNIPQSELGSSYIGFYLSTNTTFDDADILEGANTFRLGSDAIYEDEAESFTIPNSIPSGNYYVLFVADHTQNITETNETNNVAYQQLYISCATPATGDNLQLSTNISVTPSTPTKGNNADFEVYVKNNNSSAWTGGLVLQLLDQHGSYITDLDLDENISISAGTTQKLYLDSRPLQSNAGSYQLRVQYKESNSNDWITVNKGIYANPFSFNIVNPVTKTITVSSPLSTSIWESNSKPTITWTSIGFGINDKVAIDLYTGGSWYSLTTSTDNDGTFEASLPTFGSKVTNAKIRIYDATNFSIIGYSNNFTINPTIVNGDKLELYSAISLSPSIWVKGEAAQANVTIKNTGSASWSGNLVLQLLDEDNNYITDLYLDENISIPVNSTRQLPFSSNEILSNASNYKLRVQYKDANGTLWKTINNGAYINPKSFEIINKSTVAELELFSSISPQKIFLNEKVLLSVSIINNNKGTFNGIVAFKVIDSEDFVTVRSPGIVYDIDSVKIKTGEVYKHTMSPSMNTSKPSEYYVLLLAYNDQGIGGLVSEGEYSNPQVVTVENNICNFTDCNSSDCGYYGTQTYEAVQYLCEKEIVQGFGDNTVRPTENLIREHFAPLLFTTVYGKEKSGQINDILQAHYPNPFNDLQEDDDELDNSFKKYARVLSYLEYGDGISPFRRDHINFNPTQTILRKHFIVACLEAWDIKPDWTVTNSRYADVSANNDCLGWIERAAEYGFINTDNVNFRPDDDITREEAFIILKDIHQKKGEKEYNTFDFFKPGSFRLNNLGYIRGSDEGNFSYGKHFFSIPDVGVGLSFGITYNSFLQEIPDEILAYEPLGRGWTHTYQAYLQEVPASYDYQGNLVASAKVFIVWPSGAIHVYDKDKLEPVTFGLYDKLEKAGSGYTITTKYQQKYTFVKQSGGVSSIFHLTTIQDHNGNELTLEYQQGYLQKVIAPSGRFLQFAYDDLDGKLQIKQIGAPGKSKNNERVVSIDYHSNSKMLKSFKDAEKNETKFTYDKDTTTYLEIIELPKGNTITNEYNDYGKIKSSKNSEDENATTFTISDFNDLQDETYYTSTVAKGSLYVTREYDPNGQVQTIETPTSNVSINYHKEAGKVHLPQNVTSNDIVLAYDFDDNGNLLSINKPEGVKENYTYYDHNRIKTYTDGENHTWTYAYDEKYNPTSIIDPLGFGSTMKYDDYGQLEKYTSPVGLSSTFGYDGTTGDLKTQTLPDGKTISMTYDYASRLETSTYEGATSQVEYNDNDHVVLEKDVLDHSTRYKFDKNDLLEEIINARNQSTYLEYDDKNRLIEEEFGGAKRTYTYNDSLGVIQKVTKAGSGSFNYEYYTSEKLEGLLKSINGDVVEMSYYEDSKLLKTAKNELGTIAFEYDDLHRIEKVTDHENKTVAYTYYKNSLINTVKYPNGNVITYEYYDNNWLKSVKDWNDKSTHYEYYDDGMIKEKRLPNGVITSFTYEHSRLKTKEIKTSTGGNIISYTFEYDERGNITNENPVATFYKEYNPVDTLISYTYDDRNRITKANDLEFEFDGDGNCEEKGATKYEFDIFDRLINVNIEAGAFFGHYKYDAFGLRREAHREGVATKYTLDIVGGLDKVLVESGEFGDSYYYVHGMGMEYRINTKTGAYEYYHHDYRGSTVAMTNETEEVLNYYNYDIWGLVHDSKQETSNRYRYVGKYGLTYEHDDLYFMRARFYDPIIHRFLSEDPIWAVNLYPYAGNNSVGNVDLDGEIAIPVLLIPVVGAGIGATVGFVGNGIYNVISGDKFTKNWKGATIGGAIAGGVMSFGTIGGAVGGVGYASKLIYGLYGNFLGGLAESMINNPEKSNNCHLFNATINTLLTPIEVFGLKTSYGPISSTVHDIMIDMTFENSSENLTPINNPCNERILIEKNKENNLTGSIPLTLYH